MKKETKTKIIAFGMVGIMVVVAITAMVSVFI